MTGLSLAVNDIRDDGAAFLGSSPYFKALAHLDLTWNIVGPAGIHAIATSSHLASLNSLTVGNFEQVDLAAARAVPPAHTCRVTANSLVDRQHGL
ncbi:MAG: hypothetical protein ACRC8S_21580 [Fimbriiglobus sp.]